MRLIDADELKKEARMIDWLCNIQVVSLEEIDNAPTVSDRYSEGYADGYIDGATGADYRGDIE